MLSCRVPLFLLIFAVFSSANCRRASVGPDAGVTVDGPTVIDAGTNDASESNVEPDRLIEFVRDLSADEMKGRLTGAPSGMRAEAYVVDKMRATGLKVEVVDTNGIPFPLFDVGTPIELSIVDEAGKAVDPFRYHADYREVDFSGSGVAIGNLFFVGYGDDGSYAGMDVTGGVVGVLSSLPSGKAARLDEKIHIARQHGAGGVIVVLSGEQAELAAEQPAEMEVWATDDDGKLHPELLPADMPVAFVQLSATSRLFGRSAHALATNASPFSVAKRVRLEIHGVTYGNTTCRNVFGIMPGTGPEVVILGAHYDHLGIGGDGAVFRGASDNASGTAVVLEAASVLASMNRKPTRTIVFALFCGEEQGLIGSVHYVAKSPLVPLRDTKLMIQVDYLGESDGPYITNIDDNPLLLAFMGNADQHPDLPLRGLDWGGGCGSDDCAFRYVGVPAYRLISYGAHHHRASDSFENLNPAILHRVSEVVVTGLTEIGFDHEPTRDGGVEDAGSDCDLVSPSACGTSRKCTFVDNQGAVGCGPAGEKGDLEPCANDTECKAGFFCARLRSDPTRRCRAFCHGHSDCPQTSTPQFCNISFAPGGTPVLCIPMTPCDVFAQDCPMGGDACYPTASGVRACYPEGSRGVGVPCDSSGDCVKAMVCVGPNSAPKTCMPLCDPSGTHGTLCSPPTTCMSIGDGLGVCQ